MFHKKPFPWAYSTHRRGFCFPCRCASKKIKITKNVLLLSFPDLSAHALCALGTSILSLCTGRQKVKLALRKRKDDDKWVKKIFEQRCLQICPQICPHLHPPKTDVSLNVCGSPSRKNGIWNYCYSNRTIFDCDWKSKRSMMRRSLPFGTVFSADADRMAQKDRHSENIRGGGLLFCVPATNFPRFLGWRVFSCHFRNNSQADTQCAYAGEKYKNEEGGKIVQNFANAWGKELFMNILQKRLVLVTVNGKNPDKNR